MQSASRRLSENLPFVNSKKLPSGHRFFSDRLKESYCRWINWAIKVFSDEDTWFVTMTFKREENFQRSVTLCNRWLKRLIQVYEYKKLSHRLRWIRALAFQARGVIHFHLLICAKDLDLLSRKRFEHRWESMDWNSGTCRIYKSGNEETARYFSREISKEGDIDWGGTWKGLTTPGAVRNWDMKVSPVA